jgi:hypothetical protein
MKQSIIGMIVATIFLPAAIVQAQTSKPQTLASTMDIYVFPTKGQTASKQSTDEVECYNWAAKTTGTDPFQLTKRQQQQQQQAQASKQAASQTGTGWGARGAAGGAAGGALIGAMAGDAGKGAAIGAATGFVFGRVRARQAQSEQEQQIEQQSQASQQATSAQMENFKKAFTVCMEAKNYMVKY